MQRERVVIIGAGPAGCAAAVQCIRLGVRPLLLDRTGEAGGLVSNAFLVENYLGVAPVSGTELAAHMRAHLARFGIDVTHGEARHLAESPQGYVVSSNFGQTLARVVIVAVGTRAIRFHLPGSETMEGRLLFNEVAPLLSSLPRPRSVAIIGGGEAALDYALTLSRAGASVTILVRGPSLRARGRLVQLANRTTRIQIQFETRVNHLEAGVEGVALETTGAEGTRKWQASAVLAAVGRRCAGTDLLAPLTGSGAVSCGDGEGCLEPSLAHQRWAWTATREQVRGRGGDGEDTGAPSLDSPDRQVATWPARPDLHVVGDARHGSLGQVGMAVGDGLRAAMSTVAYLDTIGMGEPR